MRVCEGYEGGYVLCRFKLTVSGLKIVPTGLDTSQPFVRDLKKKQDVTNASLEKIEKSPYPLAFSH